MARAHSSGFELNSTATNVEWSVVGTGQTIVSSVTSGTVRSGTYCGKVSGMTTGTPCGFLYKWLAATATGPFYLRTALYIHTLPSASNHIISFNGASGTVGSTSRSKITLESNGTLILRNGAGTQIGSASAALTLNTWYYIELQHNAANAGATDILEARINGSVFATDATQTLSNVFAYSIGGNMDSEAQTTGEWYFDDTCVNDNTGSFQNSYPGDGRIIHLHPNAAGDNNAFTVNVGGTAGAANNYTRVLEITPDDATTYNGDVLSGDIDDFNIDNTPSSIGSSDTINVVHVGVRYNAAVAAAEASFQVRTKKISGGTVNSSTAITPISTGWATNANAVPHNYPTTLYQDPDSSNWTKATLDTAQIGYNISTTNTNAADISTIWMLIDSTPVAGPSLTTGSTVMMMGI